MSQLTAHLIQLFVNRWHDGSLTQVAFLIVTEYCLLIILFHFFFVSFFYIDKSFFYISETWQLNLLPEKV